MSQMTPREREDKNLKSHTLFKTGDPKAPDQILDRNGEVVLGLCTKCSAAEAQLYEEDCLTRLLQRSVERMAGMGSLEKALMFARQRRSWVVGGMMLGDDGKEGLSRERAEELYRGLPEGALLAALEERENDVSVILNGEAYTPPKGTRVVSVWGRLGRDPNPLAPVRQRQGDAEARKAHYGDDVQPWDIIVAQGWGEMFAASNVIKYLRRTKNPEHSLESARWYYARLIEGAAGANPAAPYGRAWQLALDKLDFCLTQDERKLLRG